MIKFVEEKYFTNAIDQIKNDERFHYFENSQIAFYHKKQESELMKDYSFMIEYIEECGDVMNVQSYIKTFFEGREFELTEGVWADVSAAIEIAQDFLEVHLWETIEEGEESFQELLNDVFSEVVSVQIKEMIYEMEDNGLKYRFK